MQDAVLQNQRSKKNAKEKEKSKVKSEKQTKQLQVAHAAYCPSRNDITSSESRQGKT